MDSNIETYAAVLATLVTAGWSILRASQWWQDHVVKPRHEAAVNAVAVGVQTTYNEFVREKKATLEPGEKLSISDGEQARRMAGEIARAYAAKEGPKVLKILTDEFLHAWIERKVREGKQ